MALKIDVSKAVREIHESPQQLSIDPKKLLNDINNLIGNGNTMELEKDIDGIKVDNELERLKREMKF